MPDAPTTIHAFRRPRLRRWIAAISVLWIGGAGQVMAMDDGSAWRTIRETLEREGPAAAEAIRPAGARGLACRLQELGLELELRGAPSTRRALDSLATHLSPLVTATARARLARLVGDDATARRWIVDRSIGDLSPLDRWWWQLERAWSAPGSRASAATIDSVAALLREERPTDLGQSALDAFDFEIGLFDLQAKARFVERDTTLARADRLLATALAKGRRHETIRVSLLQSRLLALFGRTATAMRAFEQTIERADSLGATRHAALARSYYGLSLEAARRYRSAIPLRRAAMSAFEALDDSLGFAHALLGLGWDLDRVGEGDEAIEVDRRALEVWTALGNAWGQAQSGNNLGVALFGRGRLAEAEPVLERALDAADRSGNPGQSSMILNNLALVRSRRGRPDLAVETYRDLLARHRSTGNEAAELEVLNNLGLACLDLGEFGEARTYFDAVVLLGVQRDRPQLAARNNLAMIDANEGRWEDAESGFLAAIAEARPRSDVGAEALAWAWLGRVAYRRGHSDLARTRLIRADSLHVATGTSGARVATLLRLAAVEMVPRHVDSAFSHLDRAESLARDLSVPTMAVRAQALRADALRIRGDHASARRQVREAFSEWRALRDGDVEGLRQQDLRDSAAKLVQTFVRCSDPDSTLLVREALSMVLEMQAPGPARSQPSPDSGRPPAHLDSMLLREQQVRARIEGLHAVTLVSPSDSALLELAELETDLHAVRRRIHALDPGIARRLRDPIPAVPDVVGSVAPGDLVLAYVFGPTTLDEPRAEVLLFVIEAGRPVGVHRLGSRESLGRRIRLWLDLVASPSSDPARVGNEQRLAESVGESLLGPAKDAISRARRVIVLGDGPVHGVPFAALIVGPEGTRLVERVSTAHALSWNAVSLHDSEHAVAPVDLLLVSGAEVSSSGIDRLARSFRSTRRVAVETLRDSTEFGLPALPPSRVVHVSAHGSFDPQRPWRSGLYATRPRRGEEPVILLQQADLDHFELDCDLVTLAACETARTEDRSRTASFQGFAQGLLDSGARAVLATNWEVDGAVADWFTATVYEHLADGFDVAEAARAAQLQLMEEGPTADPFQWAAWIVLGDGELRVPLRRPQPFPPHWVWWGISLALLGAAIFRFVSSRSDSLE